VMDGRWGSPIPAIVATAREPERPRSDELVRSMTEVQGHLPIASKYAQSLSGRDATALAQARWGSDRGAGFGPPGFRWGGGWCGLGLLAIGCCRSCFSSLATGRLPTTSRVGAPAALARAFFWQGKFRQVMAALPLALSPRFLSPGTGREWDEAEAAGLYFSRRPGARPGGRWDHPGQWAHQWRHLTSVSTPCRGGRLLTLDPDRPRLPEAGRTVSWR